MAGPSDTVKLADAIAEYWESKLAPVKDPRQAPVEEGRMLVTSRCSACVATPLALI